MGNLLRILYSKDADAYRSDIFLDFESELHIFFLFHLYNVNKNKHLLVKD